MGAAASHPHCHFPTRMDCLLKLWVRQTLLLVILSQQWGMSGAQHMLHVDMCLGVHVVFWSVNIPQRLMYLNTCFPVENVAWGGCGAFRRWTLAGTTSLGWTLSNYNIQIPVLSLGFLCEDEMWSLCFRLPLSCRPHHYGLSPSGTISYDKPFLEKNKCT